MLRAEVEVWCDQTEGERESATRWSATVASEHVSLRDIRETQTGELVSLSYVCVCVQMRKTQRKGPEIYCKSESLSLSQCVCAVSPMSLLLSLTLRTHTYLCSLSVSLSRSCISFYLQDPKGEDHLL